MITALISGRGYPGDAQQEPGHPPRGGGHGVLRPESRADSRAEIGVTAVRERGVAGEQGTRGDVGLDDLSGALGSEWVVSAEQASAAATREYTHLAVLADHVGSGAAGHQPPPSFGMPTM